MDDFLLMDVVQPGHDLLQKILSLKFTNPFSLFKHFVECVIGAKFKHHVHIIRILKNMVEGYDVAMFECFMYLDLSDKL